HGEPRTQPAVLTRPLTGSAKNPEHPPGRRDLGEHPQHSQAESGGQHRGQSFDRCVVTIGELGSVTFERGGRPTHDLRIEGRQRDQPAAALPIAAGWPTRQMYPSPLGTSFDLSALPRRLDHVARPGQRRQHRGVVPPENSAWTRTRPSTVSSVAFGRCCTVKYTPRS